MEKLRLSLLLIGALTVVGVYLWEILSERRRVARREIEEGMDFFSYGERIAPDIEAAGAKPMPATELSAGASDPSRPSSLVEKVRSSPSGQRLAAASEDTDADKGLRQESLVFEPSPDQQQMELDEEESERPLLAVYIWAEGDGGFSGADIRRAAQENGMSLGERGVFEYPGSRQQHEDFLPWYFLANIYEPGFFPVDDMDALRTNGLVLVANDRGDALVGDDGNPVTSDVLFDQLMVIAMHLCKALGGILYLDREVLSDRRSIMEMRAAYVGDEETQG